MSDTEKIYLNNVHDKMILLKIPYTLAVGHIDMILKFTPYSIAIIMLDGATQIRQKNTSMMLSDAGLCLQ